MVQRISKLDASRILEVSPSTIDRRIERGELQVEHEARATVIRSGCYWMMQQMIQQVMELMLRQLIKHLLHQMI